MNLSNFNPLASLRRRLGTVFAGDRAAAGLLFSGILLMVLSPIVLVGGILGALFRRR
jgi:hypothetical protein